MTGRWRVPAGAVMAIAGILIAGCGSKPGATVRAAAPAAPPLTTSFVGTGGSSWAVVDMGGSSAQHDNFWQLFVRPAGTVIWKNATPPGVADNGGIVTADAGGRSLVAGFRPSQYLKFSPLAATTDDGASWSPGSLLDGGLANLPDALAAAPGRRLVALTQADGADLGTHLGASWTTLSSVQGLARTTAGRACALTRLTAGAFTSSGAPLLAGACSRPGTAGIFALSGGSWHLAGPAIPAALADLDVEVLALARSGQGEMALLQAGTGPDASLTAAWSNGPGGRWTVAPSLRTGSGQLRATAFGTGGSVGVILSSGRGETLAGPNASWHGLPALPRWTATLALGPGGRVDAIAAHLGTFADWRLSAAAWSKVQTVQVTIPYGSSG
jgi:hypothetical protein